MARKRAHDAPATPKLNPIAKKKGALGKDERVQAAEENFGACPTGHRLPHRTRRGYCTPFHCSDTAAPTVEKHLATKRAETTPEEVEGEEKKRIEKALGRYKARAAFMLVPQGLQGADAEEFFDRKMVELLPQVACDIEFDLKYGDPDQRERARNSVRDSTGRGKREAGLGGSTPMIVLVNQNGAGQLQGGPLELPWVQKAVRTITSVEVPRPAPLPAPAPVLSAPTGDDYGDE